MPPKRSATAAAVGADGGGGTPSPKRVKLSTESAGGTQRTLDAFFTSSKEPKSHRASPLRTGPRPRPQPQPQPQEVIVIDDEEGEHQVSPFEHPNERRPAAGNGSDCDCGAGPVNTIPTTPMKEEDPSGVRLENEKNSIEENDVDTDLLLARHLARAEGIDVELAKKLERDFKTGLNRLDGSGSPSNASRNIVRGAFIYTGTLFNLNFFGSRTSAAAP